MSIEIIIVMIIILMIISYDRKFNLQCTSYVTSSLLIQLINATRFRAFDSVLSDILDGIPAPSSLTSFQNNSSSSSSNKNNNNNTNNNTNANSKYSNTNNANYNQSQVQNQNNAIAESNTINSKILQDDVKNKLSQWYVQRHGVHTDGNVHEMATIIQVFHYFLLFTVYSKMLRYSRRIKASLILQTIFLATNSYIKLVLFNS